MACKENDMLPTVRLGRDSITLFGFEVHCVETPNGSIALQSTDILVPKCGWKEAKANIGDKVDGFQELNA